MISDLFPASIRGTANSIYSSGVYLGGALASLSLLLNGKSSQSQQPAVCAVGLATFICRDIYELLLLLVAAVQHSPSLFRYFRAACTLTIASPLIKSIFLGKSATELSATDLPPVPQSTSHALVPTHEPINLGLRTTSFVLIGAIGWRESHLVVAAVGFAVAVLSALLIREPAREFPTNTDSAAAAVAKGDAGEESEERESFREALAIVFQSTTVKLASLLALPGRSACGYCCTLVTSVALWRL